MVDFVTFLQPEVGGECRSNVPVPTGVWSHRFVISGWTGQMYTTRTPWAGHPGQFIRVNDYTIQSQLGGINADIIDPSVEWIRRVVSAKP